MTSTASRNENEESSNGVLNVPLLHNNEDVEQPNSLHDSDEIPDYYNFLLEFFRTKGAIQLLILSSLTGLGIGSVVGLVRLIK